MSAYSSVASGYLKVYCHLQEETGLCLNNVKCSVANASAFFKATIRWSGRRELGSHDLVHQVCALQMRYH